MPQLVEVRAALNRETNEPKYGDCILSVGDGSVKVVFKRGRAVVDLEVAKRYLTENGDVEIPALGIYRSAPIEGDQSVATSPEDLLRPQTVDSVTEEGLGEAFEAMTPVERMEAAAKLAELLSKDAAAVPDDEDGDVDEEKDEVEASRTSTAAEADPGPKTTVDEAAREGSEPVPPGTSPEEVEQPPEETEQEQRIREAQEHLEAEGEEVPEPNASTRVVPDGFDDKTAEDDLRCLAKKGDGSQCKNAAKDGGPACQMPAHQKQFAA